MDLSIVVKHSILSGLFAALAALFGKLSTTPSISRAALALLLINDHQHFLEYSVWAAQLLSIGLMVAANGLMWSQYSLALAFSKTSLLVTAINTVSNFIFTALLGRLLFGETISAEWAAGISCILLGIVLLKEQSESVMADGKKKKDDHDDQQQSVESKRKTK